jgi:SulP family sulfate permease
VTVHDPPSDAADDVSETLELSGRLDVRIRYSPTLPLVRVAGELDQHTVHTLIDALDAVVDPECPATMVLLDLRALTFCDISGLQGIEDAASALQAAGKELVLYATPPRVTGLIEMTGVARSLLQH